MFFGPVRAHPRMRYLIQTLPIRLSLLLSPFILSACATLAQPDYRSQYFRGDTEAAISTLDSPAYQSGRNAVLAYMEKGSILFDQGDYAASIATLRQAAQRIEALDYVSVSDTGKSMLANDWAATYKGEYAERLWVHSYLMMDYLLLGQFEDAAVEARKALQVIEQHPKPLNTDWFTQALIGLSFEAAGQINDAYIEYKKLAEKMPDPSALAAPLYRYADLLGFIADAQEFADLLPPQDQHKQSAPAAELIVFVASGRIPVKASGSLFIEPDVRIAFPHYLTRASVVPDIELSEAGQRLTTAILSTDLGKVAEASLEARSKTLIAKAAARTSIKQSIANSVKEQHETTGEILSALFWLLEEADTRSWRTLPERLTLIRVPLTPGSHEIVVTLPSSLDTETTHLNVTVPDAADHHPGMLIFRRLRL